MYAERSPSRIVAQPTPADDVPQTFRGNIQQIPGDIVQQTPGDELQQTPGNDLQQTPGDEVQQTPGDDLQQTPGNDLQQTPGEMATGSAAPQPTSGTGSALPTY